MSYYDKRTAKILATVLIALFTVFLAYNLRPYISAFLGAIVFSIIFLPLYRKLVEKTSQRKLSATIIIILILLIFIVPIVSAIPMMISEINQVFLDKDYIQTIKQGIEHNLKIDNISQQLPNITQNIGRFIQESLNSLIESTTMILINLTLFFFTLFYILINNKRLKGFLYRAIPFKRENNKRLIENFKDITRSTLVSTFLIALFQSILLGITFAILDIPGAVLWTFVSFILALFPVVGIPLVWVPAAIILFAQGSIPDSIIVAIVGLILSNVDIFIRSWIQKKYGQIHPLITFIGVIMGLSFFGIIGIFIGPILISYFLLMLQMYRQEYM